jgi:tetraacyldisaccharide 4'-kinase
MTSPPFWYSNAPLARMLSYALAPLEPVARRTTARRLQKPSWRAPVPVICCGNASVGGTGKTPLCLDLAVRLQARGMNTHILTRGYRGTARGVSRVDRAVHNAWDVGDEALLLAQAAPTWAGANRANTAQAAIAAGAQILIMDDGLQNATLQKTCSLLVIDGGAGFGNGHLLPAGPLREPVASAAGRCRAAVMIGHDATGAAAMLPPSLPIMRAHLAPSTDMTGMAGKDVVAFAGIGRPSKFFASLEAAGLNVRERIAFPDHYIYRASDLRKLHRLAGAATAQLVTTSKDYARLAPTAAEGITPLNVTITWEDEAGLEDLLTEAIA